MSDAMHEHAVTKTPHEHTMPPATLRLDRSRHFSTITGERTPSDPWWGIAYVQDGLPFRTDGTLADETDDNTPPAGPIIEHIEVEGGRLKPIKYHPLWNDEMRALRDRRLKAIQAPKPERMKENTGPIDPGEDINLVSWLKGEADYEPWQIGAAVKARYGVNYQDMRRIVEFLVYETKDDSGQPLVQEAEVAGYLMRRVQAPHRAA
jgi:hypothetical protein